MVNLTIDGQKVSVPQGTTIMQAAATVGIEIPRLCYLKGINEISACKVCVVEIQGQNRVVTACTTPVQEGLVVYTNSPKARSIRRTNVELILSQHDCMCATCVRSGNCSLQTLANDLGIYDIPYERDVVDTPWNQEFPLIRDSKKCIKCMRCVQICDKVQKLHIWDVQNTGARTTVDVAACGLLYQWGRKDPFPGDRILRGTNQTDYNRFDSKPIYDAAGTLLTEGSQSGGTGIRTIRTSEDLTRTNFAKSIFSPMHFLLADNWFPSEEPLKVEACDTLWYGARGKTPFDPCPEGWCVPADKNGLFAWNGLDKATTDYSPLGVFPYAGFRYRVGGGCLKNSGFNTGIWTQDTYQLSIYIIPYDQRPSIKRDRGYRSDGYSVRCAKDE